MPTSLVDLPFDLLYIILSPLDFEDSVNLSNTSKKLESRLNDGFFYHHILEVRS